MAENQSPNPTTEPSAAAETGRGFFGSIQRGWAVMNSGMDRAIGGTVSFVVGGAVDLVDRTPELFGKNRISHALTGENLNAMQGMNDWFNRNQTDYEILRYGEEIRPEGGVENVLYHGSGLLATAPMGPARALTAARAAPGALDVVADMLMGSTARQALVTGSSNLGRAAMPGTLAAAERAGLSSGQAFARAATTAADNAAPIVTQTATHTMQGTRVIGAATPLAGNATGEFARQAAMGLSYNALRATAFTGRMAANATMGIAGAGGRFALRHPFLTATGVTAADLAYNNGNLITRPAIDATLENTPLGNLTGGLTSDRLLGGLSSSFNEYKDDFANSGFGQWLMGGSPLARITMALLTLLAYSFAKNLIVGDSLEQYGGLGLNIASNVLGLALGAGAGLQGPELLRDWLQAAPDAANDIPAQPAPAPAPQMMPPAPQFAPAM